MLIALFELEANAENNVIKSFVQKQNGKSFIDPAIAQTTLPIRKYIDIIESPENKTNKPKTINKPYTKKQLDNISEKLKKESKNSNRYTVAQSKKIDEIISNLQKEVKANNRKKRSKK